MKRVLLQKLAMFSFFFVCCLVLQVHAAPPSRALRDLTALEKEAFDTLKKKFPGEILDADLKTLHELAESSEYKKFLADAYPGASVPPEFVEVLNAEGPLVDDTLYKIRPPKERYLTYYREHFGVEKVDEVTDTEHFLIHYEVTSKWLFDMMKRGGATPFYARTNGFVLGGRVTGTLVTSPPYKEMVKRRFDIEIKDKPDMSNLPQLMRAINFPLVGLVKLELLVVDVGWIKALFEKYGKSEGLLWIAIQDPALFSQIRYAFTTDKTFLKSIYEPNE